MAKTALRLEREKQRSIRNQIIITDITKCYLCRSTGLAESDKFCPNCAFPQQGTKEEMKRFIWRINNKKELLGEYTKKIGKARNVLFILAGLNLGVGLLLGIAIDRNLPMLIGGIIGFIIYLALGLWSKKSPFPAILSGFFVYITFIVIAAINDPATAVQGLIWKALIISALVYGYKAVKDSKGLDEELRSIKKARDLKIESVSIEESNDQN